MMRSAIFAIFLCFANAEHLQLNPGDVRIFESQINNTLTNFSQSLAKDDPMTIPIFEFEVSNENVQLKFIARDVVIIGFSKFVATKIKVNVIPPSMELKVLFAKPQFVVSSYDLQFKALFIPVYGKGSINLVPENVEIGVSAKIGIGSGGISIKEVSPTFNLTNSLLHVSGILNNPQLSQIVSSSTTECFPEFTKNYGKRFSALLAPTIKDILNGLLSDLVFRDQFMPKSGTTKIQTFEQDGVKAKLRIRF